MVANPLAQHDPRMTSLHIEHRVHDLGRWIETFQSFDDFRAEGGVKDVRVRHGVDDPNYIAVDLEFDSVETARAFLGRLEEQIWPNAQHFDAAPVTRILEPV